MKVKTGQHIPFWFKLWDSNPTRYVLAHVTDVSGVEQVGSPYSLSYSGNRGIYTGVGPIMGVNLFSVDYETYKDSLHTQLDSSYLPASEWAEPEYPQVVTLNFPIQATVSSNKLSGNLFAEVDAAAKVQQDKLIGFISAPVLAGSVNTPELEEHL